MNSYSFFSHYSSFTVNISMKTLFLVLILALSFGFFSCSSTKSVQNKTVPTKDQETVLLKTEEKNLLTLQYFDNSSLKQLELNGKVISSVDGSKQTASTTVLVKDRDSLGMSIFGPFGILVGQLMASSSNFVFYNAFGNEAVDGIPSAENINSVTGMPISFNDILTLLRGEVPFGEKGYTKVKKLEIGETLFSYAEVNQTHFVTTSPNTDYISQYQRKSNDGELLFHIRYNNYKIFNNLSIATESILQIPKLKTSISFIAEEVFVNQPFQSKLGFTIPSGVKRKTLN